MGTAGGPNIPKLRSAAIILDPSNFKGTSFARDRNLLDYSTWQLNGTSATGFGRNGGSDENIIISGTGPFGETTLIWEARPNGAGGADGGWVSDYFNIDHTKKYRFSVWVRRTVFVNGRFYFGLYGGSATSGNAGVYRSDNTTNYTNPYSYVTSDPPSTSELPNNEWCLVVFHVWPSDSGNVSRDPLSGRYTVANGKIGDVSLDFKWRTDGTRARHRTYLFYAESTEPRQQWVYPRVDLIDGTEPSIEELLGGSSRGLKNKVNRSQQFFIANNSRIRRYGNLPTKRNYAIDLDGTNDYIDLGSDITYKTTGGWTVETVVNFDSVPGSYDNVTSPGNFIGSDSITYNSWYWSVLSGKLALWNRSPGTWRYGSTTLSANTWYHTTLVCQPSGTSYQMYLNGIAEGGDHTTYSWNSSYAGLKIRYIGRGNGSNVRQINGQIGYFKVTTEAMSDKEVYNSFNSISRRFNL